MPPINTSELKQWVYSFGQADPTRRDLLGGKGAEPLTAKRQASRPRPVRIFFLTSPLIMGILVSLFNLASGILANTPSWNFSHNLGTD